MDVETQRRRIAAFRQRRRSKSWKRGKQSLWDFAGQGVVGLFGAFLAWRYFGSGDMWGNVVVPSIGALFGYLLLEYGIRPFVHYVWTVPEEEHLGTWSEVDRVRADFTSEVERFKRTIAAQTQNADILAGLVGLIENGMALRNACSSILSIEHIDKMESSWYLTALKFLRHQPGLGEPYVMRFHLETGLAKTENWWTSEEHPDHGAMYNTMTIRLARLHEFLKEHQINTRP